MFLRSNRFLTISSKIFPFTFLISIFPSYPAFIHSMLWDANIYILCSCKLKIIPCHKSACIPRSLHVRPLPLQSHACQVLLQNSQQRWDTTFFRCTLPPAVADSSPSNSSSCLLGGRSQALVPPSGYSRISPSRVWSDAVLTNGSLTVCPLFWKWHHQ